MQLGERMVLEICSFSCCWARKQICSWCQGREVNREVHWAVIQLPFGDPWSGERVGHAHSPDLGKLREPRQTQTHSAGRLTLSSMDLTLGHVRACDTGRHRLGQSHLLPSPHCPSGCVMSISQKQF